MDRHRSRNDGFSIANIQTFYFSPRLPLSLLAALFLGWKARAALRLRHNLEKVRARGERARANVERYRER